MHENWHPQDWLLVVEALTEYAMLVEPVDRPRADRADQLAEAIVEREGLDPERCLEQIDETWPRRAPTFTSDG